MIDFDKFKSVTGYDIETFFQRYVDFVSNFFQSIVSYYEGGVLNQEAFFELDQLLLEASKIEPLFELNDSRLNTVDMWDLLDNFTDIGIKLETAKNMSKWSRSSRLGINDISTKINRVLRQGETVEELADSIGYTDTQNNWKGIAINNTIIEEDYTLEGGSLFTISLQNNLSLDIDNIVDSLTQDSLYGKDVNRKIKFVNNDLDLTTGVKNIEQNLGVKLSSFKGNIPEFPEYGIDGEIIGSSQGAIQYPSLLRDVIAVFKDDARWSEVNIVDLVREEGAVFMKVECKTILNDSFVTNINV